MKKNICVVLCIIMVGFLIAGCADVTKKVGVVDSSVSEDTNIIESTTAVEVDVTESSVIEEPVDPEFKATMDSYEAYYDEYIEFMNLYKTKTDPADIMPQYTEMMNKYTAMSSEMQKIDPSKLDPADRAYYAEVSSRISEKLIAALE